MKTITFYFDPISPYAYLAFERLPVALQGLDYHVRYCPILFAGLLKHHGQLGPAEIAPKRDWTYRQVAWIAHEHDIQLDAPASHPFNPLPLLRMAAACADENGFINRFTTQTVFHHVWHGGADAADATRLPTLQEQLQHQIKDNDPKEVLRANTDKAIAAGVFGVPLLEVDGKHFWGQDALPMLAGYLRRDAWFATSAWDDVAKVGAGVVRK